MKYPVSPNVKFAAWRQVKYPALPDVKCPSDIVVSGGAGRIIIAPEGAEGALCRDFRNTESLLVDSLSQLR